MATKNDAKIEEQWTQFKTDMRHLTNFDPSTQKSQKFALYQAAFDQNICLGEKSTEELCLMELKIAAKFEGKLNLGNSHQST